MKKLRAALIVIIFGFFLSSNFLQAQTDPNHPNIIVIIADDLGVDISNGYHNSALMPTTPILDSLRTSGLTFMNAWSTPVCTPTRAASISGNFGVKTGVNAVPGNLDLSFQSIFKAIEDNVPTSYADAVIGKWHISSPVDYNHPQQHSVDHYDGLFTGSVGDYYSWNKVTNGVQSTETQYATSYFTDEAIDWVGQQSNPFLLWLAEVAPHTPYHVPPNDLYHINNTGTNLRKYIAAIEAMDTEIGRLLANIPADVLANTMIIYFGDNGTPGGVDQNYPNNHAKGTLYQGGIHVPMFVTGPQVTRINETEDGLVHVLDIHATILEILGHDLPGGVFNSLSFKDLLSDPNAPTRPYNYTEVNMTNTNGWTIREEVYKLIQFDDGTQEFYNLINDPLEFNNIIGSMTNAEQAIFFDLLDEGTNIRNGWSCRDLIQNGTESDIDDCCNDVSSLSTTNIGCCQSPLYSSDYMESASGDIRFISTNNYPDHDYCYNVNQVPMPRIYNFNVDLTPALTGTATSILTPQNRPDFFYGVALNGVLYAPAPAAPFIFENQNTGQYNWDWVFEPTNNQGAGMDLVSLDCASAHTGPQGYHYHGNMFEYAEGLQAGLSTTTVAPAEPVQLGWAADGYPILYRFGPDENGNLTLLQPGFELKTGDRPGDGVTAPCGPYNGKYTNDYIHNPTIGDLDECNGVQRNITLTTALGVETFDYFYMVTDSFPQIGRCHMGTRDLTFDNSNNGTLPLELLNFDAYANGDFSSINIEWTTANERNVSHFDVLRSYDGVNFESIGSRSALNVQDLQDYSFTDLVAIRNIQYYQLLTMDFDGSESLSSIVSVKTQNNRSVKLFPNPVSAQLFLSYEGSKGLVEIQVLDIHGKIVKSKQLTSESFGDKIEASVSLDDLNDAIYFIRVKDADALIHQEKIIVLK